MVAPNKPEGEFLESECEWICYDPAYIQTEVPDKPGVYMLGYGNPRDPADPMAGMTVVYVGKASSSLRARLLTYKDDESHNKWIRLYRRVQDYHSGRKQHDVYQSVWRYTAAPKDLYFLFRLSDHPAQAEAAMIQRYRLTLLNDRSEWRPLIMDEHDAAYRPIIDILKRQLAPEQLRRLEEARRRNRRPDTAPSATR